MEIFFFIIISLLAMAMPMWLVLAGLIIGIALTVITGGAVWQVGAVSLLVFVVKRFIG